MNKNEMALVKYKTEQEYSKRQVLNSIEMLRSILDRVEKGVIENKACADDGLQGNEWRLYKELSNLEKLNDFVVFLENQINSENE